jgi:hypothetical protein
MAYSDSSKRLVYHVSAYRSQPATQMSRPDDLYSRVGPGSPVTSHELAGRGVSADLAVHCVRAGWLTRLARGVFSRPDVPLDLHRSLRLLERRLRVLHVGGKSALAWHGVRHNVEQQPRPATSPGGARSAGSGALAARRCPAGAAHVVQAGQDRSAVSHARARTLHAMGPKAGREAPADRQCTTRGAPINREPAGAQRMTPTYVATDHS